MKWPPWVIIESLTFSDDCHHLEAIKRYRTRLKGVVKSTLQHSQFVRLGGRVFLFAFVPQGRRWQGDNRPSAVRNQGLMRNWGIGDPSTLITVCAPVTPVIAAQQEGKRAGDKTDLRLRTVAFDLLHRAFSGLSTFLVKVHT